MKRTLFMTILAGALLSCASAFAVPTGSYDVLLEVRNNFYEYGLDFNQPLPPAGGFFAFDYWYEPDPIPELGGPYTYGVPQEIRVQRRGTYLECQRLWSFYPSTTWETTVMNVPLGSEMMLTMPIHSTNDFEVTEIGFPARTLYNKYYLRNFRSFDTYEDYLASIGQDGNEPVPEPASMAMLCSGMLGLLGFEMKRRKALKK